MNNLLTLKEVTNERKNGCIVAIFDCACGSTKKAKLSEVNNNRTRSCGCIKEGSSSPFWKGGKTTSKAGYIRVSVGCGKNRVRVFEHRLVMEKHLGRKLEKHENIHHKNGIKDDNSLENLEVWSTSQPEGSRLEDLIDWSLKIIELYEKTFSLNKKKTKVKKTKSQMFSCKRIEGGYYLIKNEKHPNALKDGYIFEHRFLMSEILGRPLTSKENVHHKDGNKLNNNLDNLELWIKPQPCGQRIEDKLKRAKDILSEYYPM